MRTVSLIPKSSLGSDFPGHDILYKFTFKALERVGRLTERIQTSTANSV